MIKNFAGIGLAIGLVSAVLVVTEANAQRSQSYYNEMNLQNQEEAMRKNFQYQQRVIDQMSRQRMENLMMQDNARLHNHHQQQQQMNRNLDSQGYRLPVYPR